MSTDSGPQSSPLRLEWLDPEQLDDNPENWRTHPDNQKAALTDMLAEVGWAGALLYNEKTKRLVDGHARKRVARGKVPVLIGSWTEEQERKILATLDPIGTLANADAEALDRLLREVNIGSPEVSLMLEQVAHESGKESQQSSGVKAADKPSLEKMEVMPYEQHDYVLVLARTSTEWALLCGALGLKQVDSAITEVKTMKKIGLGRCIKASTLLDLLAKGNPDAPPKLVDPSGAL